MYAIIADGGRQYKVRKGQQLDLDYRRVPAGESIRFDRVLAISGEGDIRLGKPTVAGACVVGEVVGMTQGKKIIVQKFRRRKNYRRRTGHRQLYTTIRIDDITLNGASILEETTTDQMSDTAGQEAADEEAAKQESTQENEAEASEASDESTSDSE